MNEYARSPLDGGRRSAAATSAIVRPVRSLVPTVVEDDGSAIAGWTLDDLRADQLHRIRVQLSAAEQLGHLGTWSWTGTEALWSDEMCRIHDLSPNSGPRRYTDLLALVHPEDLPGLAAAITSSVEAGGPYEYDYRLLLPDGSIRFLSSRGAVEIVDGRAVRGHGCCQDVTERHQTELHNRQIQADLEHQEWVLGRIARGASIDRTLEALCMTFEARYPGTMCSVQRLDPDDQTLRNAAGPSVPGAFRRAVDRLVVKDGNGACGTAAATNEIMIVEDVVTDPLTAAYVDACRENGLRSVWSCPLNDSSGAVTGTFAVYRSTVHRPDRLEIQSLRAAGSLAALAIERHRIEGALTAAARLDPLTGLPNRSRFLELLRHRMSTVDAHVAVLFLDLDRFKWINDSLGHRAGDRILLGVAQRLRNVLREGDVVARFGGDEFTIMLADATTEDAAEAAKRLDAALLDPFVLDTGEFFVSASTGIAMNDHEADADGLVRDADAAMYVAKQRGRARHAVYDEGLRNRAIERVTLESDLRRAIDRQEISLVYQPLTSLHWMEWTGVEALVRWNHPTRGLIMPNDFIPIAEETGLIVPLGSLILDQAAANASILTVAGHQLTMSVNMSVLQLTDPAIPNLVAKMLTRHHLAPAMLTVEVTETAVMEQFDVTFEALERIAALGVRIVIDDFGTGYSSIARLGDLPVAGVKIDHRFASQLGIDPNAMNVFSAITNLAHAFGLTVVAEGIDTQDKLDRVQAVGCDGAQGYHIAMPMSAAELTRRIERNQRLVP